MTISNFENVMKTPSGRVGLIFKFQNFKIKKIEKKWMAMVIIIPIG